MNHTRWEMQRHTTVVYSATSRIPQLQRRCLCHRKRT